MTDIGSVGALSGAIDLFSPLKSAGKSSTVTSFEPVSSAAQTSAPRNSPKAALGPVKRTQTSGLESALIEAQQAAQKTAQDLSKADSSKLGSPSSLVGSRAIASYNSTHHSVQASSSQSGQALSIKA
jgi:hypothetical protein